MTRVAQTVAQTADLAPQVHVIKLTEMREITHLYGVISRISVSLITCTCGARSSGLGYSLGYAGHDQYS